MARAPLVFAFAPARVCQVLPSTWPPLGSVKLLLLRPVGMHGAGVLAGRRRLVRVSGLALRPTMLSALMSVWTHAVSLGVGRRLLEG